MRMPADTARDPSGHARRGGCELHGVTCCPMCCKHDGECDYGDCTRPATGHAVIRLAATGAVVERRGGCSRCLPWMVQNPTHGYTAEIERAA